MDGRRHGIGYGPCGRGRRQLPRLVAGRGRQGRTPTVAPSAERAAVTIETARRSAGSGPADGFRVGDRDREHVIGRLCVAAGEGRLTLAEVADRQASAYAARFPRELATLLVDLPAEVPDAALARTGRPGRTLLRDAVRTILVINGIALCVGLSAIPGAAGLVALLSGITIMLAVVIIELR